MIFQEENIMLIIPYVCAEFRDKKGNPIFRISADMLHTMQDVPEAIRQDRLFDLLVADGSIKTPETVAQRKLLEQDPMIEMGADGKKITKVKAGEKKADEKSAETKPAETKPAEDLKKEKNTGVKRKCEKGGHLNVDCGIYRVLSPVRRLHARGRADRIHPAGQCPLRLLLGGGRGGSPPAVYGP